MTDPFAPLLARMQELRDLSGAVGLLTWDQETYMPAKADEARGAQLSTLQGLYHERLTDPAFGEQLGEASQKSALSADQKAMVRVQLRERDRAVNVPVSLVRAIAEAQSHGITAWRAARAAKDFGVFRPALERLLKLRREQADAIGHSGQRYDALLDGYEPGMTVARVGPVLQSLSQRLVPIIQAVSEACRRRGPSALEGKRFDVDKQWRFTMRLLKDMGFDLEAGRQDKSIHPFTGGTHPMDVRLTTRLAPETPFPAIFGTIHECGHGLYEQGFAEEHFRTPIAQAPSMGVHESQSRFWENLVGRSRPFWTHYYPVLQGELPEALASVTLQQFHEAMNRVEPSLIRVDADEVTYNQHIALRYELEVLLLSDMLPVTELPQAWSERMERLLGVKPTNDANGALQDIHWATGDFGYFPTYSLGNLYSAQLWNAARRALPTLEADIAKGTLLPLRDWLRQKIHREGYRHGAEELIQRATGKSLTDDDFVQYLKEKYSALYGVSLKA